MNKVLILISTYNGEKFLPKLLDSLTEQTYKNLMIIARDDGSTDRTRDILNSYDIKILPSSENIGAKKSFSKLIEYALQNTDSNYFMFSDQDDVWKTDKVENTLEKMQEMEKKYLNKPILVHTDLEVVDKDLQIVHNSFFLYQKLNPKYASLNNLLVQNNITGCTIMINRRLAKIALPIPSKAIMHDWWLGLVAAYFGQIAFLDEQTILYRQHEQNHIGAKKFDLVDLIKKFRFKEVFMKKELIAQAKDFFDMYYDLLDYKTIEMLNNFIIIEKKSFFKRKKIIFKYKLYKQNYLRNINFILNI